MGSRESYRKILQDAVVHAGYERVKNALKLLCE